MTAEPRRPLRHSAMFACAALTLMIGVLLPIAPAASARGQSVTTAPTGKFALDQLISPTSTCPAGFTDLGPTFSSRACRPVGYDPIIDGALCDQANQAGSLGVRVTFFPVASVCVWTGSNTAEPCPEAAFTLNEQAPVAGGIPVTGCALPVLVRDASSIEYAAAACIESAVVQESAAAAQLTAGAEFRGDDGRLYIIATGGTCTFGCVGGFDANCDGVLGDYCASELSPNVVADVAVCLADLAAAPVASSQDIDAGPASMASSPDAETVQTPTTPQVVHVGVLAHTGAETPMLAYLGVALFGAGGTLLVGLRRQKHRTDSALRPDSN